MQSHISTKADLTTEIPEYGNNGFGQKVKISKSFPLIPFCSDDKTSNGLERRGVAGIAVVYAGLVFALRATQAVPEIGLPWDFNGRRTAGSALPARKQSLQRGPDRPRLQRHYNGILQLHVCKVIICNAIFSTLYNWAFKHTWQDNAHCCTTKETSAGARWPCVSRFSPSCLAPYGPLGVFLGEQREEK